VTNSTINLPTTAFSALRRTPTEFVQEMRIAAAIKWYGLEQISQSKADEFADFGRFRKDFLWAV
jgi:hypothetical protein